MTPLRFLRALLFASLCTSLWPVAAKPAGSCGAQADFLVRSDPTLAPIRPVDCSTVTQTPPEFTWPPQNGKNTYEVVLKLPGGKLEKRATTHNWLLWDKTLPPGDYSWQVKVSGESNYTSEPRTFRIAPNVIITSVIVGGVTGLLGGFIPAVRAARLRPIDALKS